MPTDESFLNRLNPIKNVHFTVSLIGKMAGQNCPIARVKLSLIALHDYKFYEK